MGCIRLERIERETNKYRYYLVTWTQTLWRTWAVWRQWGRISEEIRGAQIDECATEEEALQQVAETIELRMQHGYKIKSTLQP